MKTSNFFKKKKHFFIQELFPNTNFKKKIKINEIRTLDKSTKLDITFFDSIKYKHSAVNTKASYCITTKKLENFLPKSVEKIIVKNVLLELANVIKKIYPEADVDHLDLSLKNPSKKKFKSVKIGNNVLIGKTLKLVKILRLDQIQ